MVEIKLESSLTHQQAPVNAVATIVEASIKEQTKASLQNPVLTRKLNAAALEQVRREGALWSGTRRSFRTHGDRNVV